MNVLIIADLEGVAGVYDLNNIEECNELYTEEISVILSALKSQTIYNVTICDVHDCGKNLNQEFLFGPGITFISGVWNLDLSKRYDLALMSGFHGKAGSISFSPHTFRLDIKKMEINKIGEVGEIALFMTWLYEYKIPVTLVIGDSAACDEALEIDKNVGVCIVKEVGRIDDIKQKHKLIIEKVKATIARNNTAIPLVKKEGIKIEFINNDILYYLKDQWNIDGNQLTFKDSNDFISNLENLCYSLNKIDKFILSRNRDMLYKDYLILSKFPKQIGDDSSINAILKKTMLELSLEDLNEISHFTRKLVSLRGN